MTIIFKTGPIFYFWVRNRFLPLLTPKSHFGWLGVPQTPILPFELGDTGSNFGESFDEGWKTFPGPSIPENMEKIHSEMGEKLGAQFWGFKLLITHGFKCIGKAL